MVKNKCWVIPFNCCFVVKSCEDFNPMNVMKEALEPIELDYTNLPTEFKYRREVI